MRVSALELQVRVSAIELQVRVSALELQLRVSALELQVRVSAIELQVRVSGHRAAGAYTCLRGLHFELQVYSALCGARSISKKYLSYESPARAVIELVMQN